MKVFNFEQRSEVWVKARLGIFTASKFDKIITPTGKPSTQVKDYIYDKIAETITGEIEEVYQSEAMIRGSELEKDAIQAYQESSFNIVTSVGFCLEGYYGCSPDGFVGNDGLIEVKCPLRKNHFKYLIEKELPTMYIPQVQGNLLVTGRSWCDFISYYPGIGKNSLFVKRVYRDDQFINKLEKELDNAIKLKNKIIMSL